MCVQDQGCIPGTVRYTWMPQTHRHILSTQHMVRVWATERQVAIFPSSRLLGSAWVQLRRQHGQASQPQRWTGRPECESCSRELGQPEDPSPPWRGCLTCMALGLDQEQTCLANGQVCTDGSLQNVKWEALLCSFLRARWRPDPKVWAPNHSCQPQRPAEIHGDGLWSDWGGQGEPWASRTKKETQPSLDTANMYQVPAMRPVPGIFKAVGREHSQLRECFVVFWGLTGGWLTDRKHNPGPSQQPYPCLLPLARALHKPNNRLQRYGHL